MSCFVFIFMMKPKTKPILFNNQFNWLHLLMQLINISAAPTTFNIQAISITHTHAGKQCEIGEGRQQSWFLTLFHFVLFYFSWDYFLFPLGKVCFHWLLISLRYIIIFSKSLQFSNLLPHKCFIEYNSV